MPRHESLSRFSIRASLGFCASSDLSLRAGGQPASQAEDDARYS